MRLLNKTIVSLGFLAFICQAERFDNPTVENYPLHWCYFIDTDCDKIAADHFCHLKIPNSKAKAWDYIKRNTRSPTWILGEKKICDPQKSNQCRAFSYIECVLSKSRDNLELK